jgi:Cu+-exporting ATPase
MRLDPEKAAAREDYGGWVYFFCSNSCHLLFTQSPERFAQKHKAAPPGEAATETD